MANTTNLNLVKPAGTDKALVSVLNSNSDKIDAWAGTTNQALSNIKIATNLGGMSVSALESEILNKANDMRVGETTPIQVNVTPSSGVFVNTVYTGTIKKAYSNPVRINVILYSSKDNSVIIGTYNSSWAWDQLALKSDIITEEISGIQPDDAISAGTPGTRGAQKIVSYNCPSGYKVSSVIVTYSNNSNLVHPFVFLSNANLYVNWYRASTNAVDVGSAGISLRLTYVNS